MITGLVLAGVTVAFARLAGFEREKSCYPLLLIFIAALYPLFAAIDGSERVVTVEVLVMTFFIVLAMSGFKVNAWWLVTGFAAHGLWDYFHDAIIYNRGIPPWWPGFCLVYDVTIALYLFFRSVRSGS